MKLREMSPGQRGRVAGYCGMEREYRRKLMVMGLNRGVEFTVIRSAPLGDPLEIEVRGYHLTLRKDEAEGLEVEPVGDVSGTNRDGE